FGNQGRETIVLTISPPIFDRHVPVLDVTGLAQAPAKSCKVLAVCFERCEMKKADHRHRLLLARAASGHASAAPPMSVMKSRLFTRSPRRRGPAASVESRDRACERSGC